jgi:hypothetical protein
MTLYEKNTTDRATRELMDILEKRKARDVCSAVPTKDLVNTPLFHGQRTLEPRQVSRLLLTSGRVNSVLYNFGHYQQKRWWLRSENEPERHISR